MVATMFARAGVAPRRQEGALQRGPSSAPNIPSSTVNASPDHASATRLTTSERIRISEVKACKPSPVHEVRCERCAVKGFKCGVQPGSADASQASCSTCKGAVETCSFLRLDLTRPDQTPPSLEPIRPPISAKERARLVWKKHQIEPTRPRNQRRKRARRNHHSEDAASDSEPEDSPQHPRERGCVPNAKSPAKRPRLGAPRDSYSTHQTSGTAAVSSASSRPPCRMPPLAPKKLTLPKFKRTSQLAMQSKPVATEKLVLSIISTPDVDEEKMISNAYIGIVDVECRRGQELYSSIDILIKQLQFGLPEHILDAKDDIARYIEQVRSLEQHQEACSSCCVDSCEASS